MQDAAFVNDSLACFNSDEVFNQLKASKLRDLDFNLPSYTLVLRKWHDGHQNGMEFRAYIMNGHLRALQ